jgi:hypothetical protein
MSRQATTTGQGKTGERQDKRREDLSVVGAVLLSLSSRLAVAWYGTRV